MSIPWSQQPAQPPGRFLGPSPSQSPYQREPQGTASLPCRCVGLRLGADAVQNILAVPGPPPSCTERAPGPSCLQAEVASIH